MTVHEKERKRLLARLHRNFLTQQVRARVNGLCASCRSRPADVPGKKCCSRCLLLGRFYYSRLPEEEKARAIKAFESFDGKCEICGTTEPGGPGWCFDHKGQKFRGILCFKCNFALGLMNDDENALFGAINYLRERF